MTRTLDNLNAASGIDGHPESEDVCTMRSAQQSYNIGRACFGIHCTVIKITA